MTSPIDHLIHELSKLPGIGEKTAMRLALHILKQDPAYPLSLSKALTDVAQKIRFCESCFHFTEAAVNPCSICRSADRNRKIICVVEDSSDLLAIEKSRGHKGLYHVLLGALSPLDGIGPNELKIRELLERVRVNEAEECLLATNPTVTGDTTALYISKILKPLGVRVTRLAAGIPVGGQIEYIDAMTLSRAIESRREY